VNAKLVKLDSLNMTARETNEQSAGWLGAGVNHISKCVTRLTIVSLVRRSSSVKVQANGKNKTLEAGESATETM
jgi:hypothetical protein